SGNYVNYSFTQSDTTVTVETNSLWLNFKTHYVKAPTKSDGSFYIITKEDQKFVFTIKKDAKINFDSHT
ncbi:MAG: hypothetical protein MRZ91_02715, partial [Christensenellaceae bacterium]|nr:hypothetical protein [Christensenellaceae bacterium]